MEEATHKEQMEVALKALAAKKAAGHSTPVTAPTGKGAGTGGGLPWRLSTTSAVCSPLG